MSGIVVVYLFVHHLLVPARLGTTELTANSKVSLCNAGTYGPGCKFKCNTNCSQSCDPVTGECNFISKDGLYGTHCEYDCSPGYYGRLCGNACSEMCVNFCDTRTGACNGGCTPGYQGLNCNKMCENGKYGHACEENCSPNCNNGCDPVTGKCLGGCKEGFQGNNCAVCAIGQYGNSCLQECSENCKTARECNHVTGKCNKGCQNGYKNDDCKTLCEDGTYGEVCKMACGRCKYGTSCNKDTGHCAEGCEGNFVGEKCNECPSGFYGEHCRLKCGHCSPGASCNSSTGICLISCLDSENCAFQQRCEENWSGERCDVDGHSKKLVADGREMKVSNLDQCEEVDGYLVAPFAIAGPSGIQTQHHLENSLPHTQAKMRTLDINDDEDGYVNATSAVRRRLREDYPKMSPYFVWFLLLLMVVNAAPHSVSSIIDICVVSIFSVLVLFGLIFCCTRIMRQRRSGNIDSKPMELHEIPLSHTSPPQQPTVHETFTPRAASVYYNEVQENVRHETIREDSSKLDGHLKPIMKSYSDQSVSLDLKSSVKIQEL
ncbi:hypothetical protein B566_EDAN006775 [Ephemera danica]|nr:hypothetical protein B566_EDAN006775 [Ephemera danica]